MQKKIVQGFLSIFSAQIGFLFIGVVITPFLVRILGSEEYGDYAFVLSIILVLMIFANAGIFDGVRKYLAEDRSVDGWQNAVFGYYVRIATITSLIIAFLVVGGRYTGLVRLVVDPQFEIYLYLAAVVIFVRQFFYTVRGILMGIGLEHYGEPLRVVKQALFAICGLTLAYIGYGVAGVLLGHIIAHISIGIVGLAIVARNLDIYAIVRPAPPELPTKKMLTFNSWTIALMALLFSLYHVDILMLQPIVGSEQTGYYKAALVIAEFLWIVPIALQLILLQSVSELWSRDERKQVSYLAARTTRYTLLLTLLFALGLGALADPFVRLYYGPDFTAAVGPLLFLLPGAIGFALAHPIYSIGQGIGRLRVLVLATTGAAVLNFILNFILIPLYGMYGAAIATSIGYGSMFVLHVIAARFIGYDPLQNLRLIPISLTVAISAPVIIGLAIYINTPIISLIVVPLVGLVVFSLAALQFNAISADEICEFTTYLPASFYRLGQIICKII